MDINKSKSDPYSWWEMEEHTLGVGENFCINPIASKYSASVSYIDSDTFYISYIYGRST